MSKNSSESEDSTPPIPISKSTRIAAPLYIILSFSTALVVSALALGDLRSTDATNTKAIVEVKAQQRIDNDRIKVLELNSVKLEYLQADITRIRNILEGRYSTIPTKTETNPNGH